MQLSDLTRALRRRWYVLLVGAVLSSVAGVLAWNAVGPAYTATGSAVLIPPKNSVNGTGVNGVDLNPLMLLADLGQARDVMLSVMSSDDIEADFEDKFPDATYTVTNDTMSSGPILIISVEAPDPTSAVDGVEYLYREAESQIKVVQSRLQVTSEATIDTMQLTQATEATLDIKGELRAAILAGGGLFLLFVFAVALTDGLAVARRRGEERREAIASWLTSDPSPNVAASGPAVVSPTEPAEAPAPESTPLPGLELAGTEDPVPEETDSQADGLPDPVEDLLSGYPNRSAE